MRVSLTGLCGAGQMGLALLALLSVFTGRGDLWSVGQMAEIAMTVGAVPLWSQETGRSGFLRGASPPPHIFNGQDASGKELRLDTGECQGGNLVCQSLPRHSSYFPSSL